MNPLSGFSDWTIALLPRLLVPGGIYVLAAIALFCASNFRDRRGRSALYMLLRALSRENVLALAATWVVIAIVPFSDLRPLPVTVSIITLLALPLVSLALVARQDSISRAEIAGTIAVTVAVLVTTLPGKSLLPAAGLEGAGWLALAAGLPALTGMGAGIQASINGALRWLALGSIALIPLYSKVPSSQWTALIVLLPLAGLALLLHRLRWTAIALYLAWIAALSALITTLLQPS